MNQSLGAAILKKDKFAIEDFLKAGADPNALIPGEEFAPIHLGAGTSKSITELLLRYGADPNARTPEGSTPLHIAASWEKGSILKLLLKYGADISIRDNEEIDALGVAAKYGSQNCIHILQNHERKHEIDIQGNKHKPSSAFDQIELTVYLNRIKLISTCISGISKMFQLPNQIDRFADQDFQFADQNNPLAEDNPIIAKNYETEEDEYNYEFERPDEDILTRSRSPSLISLPVRERFSATSPHEQVQQRNEINKKDHLSNDQLLDTNIRQGSNFPENPSTKIESSLINELQNRSHNELPESGSDQCRTEAFENPTAESFFHPFLSRQQTHEIRDSANNFQASQHMIYPSDLDDVLTQAECQTTETVYIEQTQLHTENHLDLGSKTDEGDQTNHQVSDWVRNKKSSEHEQQNIQPKYESQKMAESNHENWNSPSFETTQNAPRVPGSCNNYPGIKSNPLCKPERRIYRKCWNTEVCAETDGNLHTSQPWEKVSDDRYPDNLSHAYKCAHVETKKREVPKNEMRILSIDSCSETSERTTKQKRFRKYSTNNLYLKLAASVNKRKGFSTEKLAPMKRAFRRMSNCRICLATKNMFARLKQKIIQ